jgi:hypothetical protein
VPNSLHVILAIIIVLFGIYIDLSLYYRLDTLVVSLLSITLFSFSVVMLLYTFRVKRNRAIAWMVYLLCVLLWFLWYRNIMPSNDRVWQKDVAVLSYATINENLITVHNIRNFSYKTESEYTVAYYDATFDLDALEGIDFIATYWMGPWIAHTFLSFSFEGNRHLAISIEARKEVGEAYSILRGFFKESELYYVVADERDVIGLRTNIRKNPPEAVYMYRINADLDDEKRVFLQYMNRLNELKKSPEFYNTLTTNCTTTIWHNTLGNYSQMRFNWEILVSGYTAKYLYDNGLLKTYGLDFEALQKRAYINPLVSDRVIDANYSSQIRKVTN